MPYRVVEKCCGLYNRIRNSIRRYNDLCDQWMDICVEHRVGITA